MPVDNKPKFSTKKVNENLAVNNNIAVKAIIKKENIVNNSQNTNQVKKVSEMVKKTSTELKLENNQSKIDYLDAELNKLCGFLQYSPNLNTDKLKIKNFFNLWNDYKNNLEIIDDFLKNDYFNKENQLNPELEQILCYLLFEKEHLYFKDFDNLNENIDFYLENYIKNVNLKNKINENKALLKDLNENLIIKFFSLLEIFLIKLNLKDKFNKEYICQVLGILYEEKPESFIKNNNSSINTENSNEINQNSNTENSNEINQNSNTENNNSKNENLINSESQNNEISEDDNDVYENDNDASEDDNDVSEYENEYSEFEYETSNEYEDAEEYVESENEEYGLDYLKKTDNIENNTIIIETDKNQNENIQTENVDNKNKETNTYSEDADTTTNENTDNLESESKNNIEQHQNNNSITTENDDSNIENANSTVESDNSVKNDISSNINNKKENLENAKLIEENALKEKVNNFLNSFKSQEQINLYELYISNFKSLNINNLFKTQNKNINLIEKDDFLNIFVEKLLKENCDENDIVSILTDKEQWGKYLKNADFIKSFQKLLSKKFQQFIENNLNLSVNEPSNLFDKSEDNLISQNINNKEIDINNEEIDNNEININPSLQKDNSSELKDNSTNSQENSKSQSIFQSKGSINFKELPTKILEIFNLPIEKNFKMGSADEIFSSFVDCERIFYNFKEYLIKLQINHNSQNLTFVINFCDNFNECAQKVIDISYSKRSLIRNYLLNIIQNLINNENPQPIAIDLVNKLAQELNIEYYYEPSNEEDEVDENINKSNSNLNTKNETLNSENKNLNNSNTTSDEEFNIPDVDVDAPIPTSNQGSNSSNDDLNLSENQVKIKSESENINNLDDFDPNLESPKKLNIPSNSEIFGDDEEESTSTITDLQNEIDTSFNDINKLMNDGFSNLNNKENSNNNLSNNENLSNKENSEKENELIKNNKSQENSSKITQNDSPKELPKKMTIDNFEEFQTANNTSQKDSESVDNLENQEFNISLDTENEKLDNENSEENISDENLEKSEVEKPKKLLTIKEHFNLIINELKSAKRFNEKLAFIKEHAQIIIKEIKSKKSQNKSKPKAAPASKKAKSNNLDTKYTQTSIFSKLLIGLFGSVFAIGGGIYFGNDFIKSNTGIDLKDTISKMVGLNSEMPVITAPQKQNNLNQNQQHNLSPLNKNKEHDGMVDLNNSPFNYPMIMSNDLSNPNQQNRSEFTIPNNTDFVVPNRPQQNQQGFNPNLQMQMQQMNNQQMQQMNNQQMQMQQGFNPNLQMQMQQGFNPNLQMQMQQGFNSNQQGFNSNSQMPNEQFKPNDGSQSQGKSAIQLKDFGSNWENKKKQNKHNLNLPPNLQEENNKILEHNKKVLEIKKQIEKDKQEEQMQNQQKFFNNDFSNNTNLESKKKYS